jgi:O-antigen ligase
MGLTVVVHQQVAVELTVVVLIVAIVAARPFLCWWDLFLVALAGSMIFSYGFVNLGLPTKTPIPLADALAVILFVRAWAVRDFRYPASLPFLLAVPFVLFAALRLAVDFPTWGKDAVRDSTLALEVVFLPIGYWAMRTYGLARWQRALNWIFVVCLGYFAFFPWADWVARLGPMVGLQRPVPLLGSYAGAGVVAAAGFFYFALVRPYGRLSYALAAGFLAELAIFQSRGLYLAVPAVAILLLLLATRRARSGLATALAVGIVALALFLPLAPQGRLGPVSPWFTVQQLRTLQGQSGPGAGSYEDRITWFHEVVGEVRARGNQGWFVGVGLGPDLVRGDRGASAEIRTPHDDYLEVFARLGIPALLLFVGMLGSAIVGVLAGARRAQADRPGESAFLWFVFAVAVVFVLIAAVQPLFKFPYGTIPCFSLLGAGLALAGARGAYRPSD